MFENEFFNFWPLCIPNLPVQIFCVDKNSANFKLLQSKNNIIKSDLALSGADMQGIARTGSGKTLAFVLPSIIHIMAQPDLRPGDGPVAVILAPTRELAKQVQEVAEQFGKPCGVNTVAVYGGADKRSQIGALERGAHIVVACPGRLLDLIQSGKKVSIGNFINK